MARHGIIRNSTSRATLYSATTLQPLGGVDQFPHPRIVEPPTWGKDMTQGTHPVHIEGGTMPGRYTRATWPNLPGAVNVHGSD